MSRVDEEISKLNNTKTEHQSVPSGVSGLHIRNLCEFTEYGLIFCIALVWDDGFTLSERSMHWPKGIVPPPTTTCISCGHARSDKR